jgi:predicted transcriptional regulator
MRQPHVARLEAGDHEPSLATLRRLAQVLGLEFHIDITPDTISLTAYSPTSRARAAAT